MLPIVKSEDGRAAEENENDQGRTEEVDDVSRRMKRGEGGWVKKGRAGMRMRIKCLKKKKKKKKKKVVTHKGG